MTVKNFAKLFTSIFLVYFNWLLFIYLVLFQQINNKHYYTQQNCISNMEPYIVPQNLFSEVYFYFTETNMLRFKTDRLAPIAIFQVILFPSEHHIC